MTPISSRKFQKMYYHGKSVFSSRTQHNSQPVISAPSNSHFRWFLNGLFTTSLKTCSCKAIPQVWPQGTCLWIDCHFYFWYQISLKGIQHQHTQFFRCTPGCVFHTIANRSSVTSLVIQALNWHMMTLICSCLSVVICTFGSFVQESCYSLIIRVVSTSCIFSLPTVSSFPHCNWQNNLMTYQKYTAIPLAFSV
jgi:hypothetical protein